MNYANIKYNDIANGPGVRTSLFVSGCRHKCKGCFNQEAWDFEYGEQFSHNTIDTIIASLQPSYIAGLTLLGGEPLDPKNQEAVLHLLESVKSHYPSKSIWCFTGYTYEKDFLENGPAYTDNVQLLFSYIDVLVDGKFVQEQYDITLQFRGSQNQRLIDLKKTRENQTVVWWEEQSAFIR